MSTYDSLHRQCRTLESLFDTKLTSYSRLASTITRSQEDLEATGSSERWKDLEAEVDELLQKVSNYFERDLPVSMSRFGGDVGLTCIGS